MERKAEIRKRIKAELAKLPAEEREAKSRQIKKHLLNNPYFKKAKNIFIYLSFQKEVDTFPIIRESLELGKTILVPWTINQKEMIPLLLNDLEHLGKDEMGIPCPLHKIPFPPRRIELVILPGLAFDKKGNRLGRGKAFYDRFLSAIDPGTRKIALAYAFQVIDSLPVSAHDVPVDEIITENGEVIRGNSRE